MTANSPTSAATVLVGTITDWKPVPADQAAQGIVYVPASEVERLKAEIERLRAEVNYCRERLGEAVSDRPWCWSQRSGNEVPDDQ